MERQERNRLHEIETRLRQLDLLHEQARELGHDTTLIDDETDAVLDERDELTGQTD